ncbi:MAG: GAF domain-containing protein [Dehalococcoidales bacterium]|nr:GAF domain-containing protein [Dehalococcoidales bacterium]
MDNIEKHSHIMNEKEITQIMELAKIAVTTHSLEEFAGQVLIAITGMTHAPSALLYTLASQSAANDFFAYGFSEEVVPHVNEVCNKEFSGVLGRGDSLQVSTVKNITGVTNNLIFYPLQDEKSWVGVLGIVSGDEPLDIDLIKSLTPLITRAIVQLKEKAVVERQLAHLNAYLSVSSMLAKSTGLQDILQIALYCSMDVVQAEAASVLILDEKKENFTFYQVEGPMKPVLAAAVFPANMGLAGSVLESQQAEVINDVSNDHRFYGNFDKESGFKTRNMIVIPLTAEEERIGVLEVINKVDTGSFSNEECILLNSIAEEISFAIRNAKIFEFVANSYCKQRQGEMSCKGCQRPLGSWTPCMRYRQAGL